ncbi:MAG: glycyl-radical enzyme activating protein, partial [Clostridiales Family XIII bacterium]|nr:glycyl-radical enzyme activating protein [Clostridiales Family XIII bacterium]
MFDIQRFSTTNGPGIRTTAFLKGCPLRCAWCHNPESQSPEPQLLYRAHLCIHCGACVAVCRYGARSDDGASHRYDANACTDCRRCADACMSGALKVAGEEMSVARLTSELLKDKPFFGRSNGGITLSGGEPSLQLDFSVGALRAARRENLHTAFDTSGYADSAAYAS